MILMKKSTYCFPQQLVIDIEPAVAIKVANVTFCIPAKLR